MQISGGTNVAGSFGVAVAKKMNASTREQGEQAVALIQSSGAATESGQAVAKTPGVGTRLNVQA